MERKNILVTGFGPFGAHTVNASWEAVKELERMFDNIRQKYGINLVTENVPVSYEHVSKRIPQLWDQYHPILVLHLGVSHIAKCLMIESRACNKGYTRLDINNKCIGENESLEKVLKTDIDINSVCSYVNANSTKTGCKACVSEDAGRYLCEYIFYNSLNIDPKCALFIHVPDLNVYTSSQTAKGIYDVICYLIKRINNAK